MSGTRNRSRLFAAAIAVPLLTSGHALVRPSAAPPAASTPAAGAAVRPVRAAPARFGGLPFAFEANRGQTDPDVKFLARTRGYTTFVTPTETVLAFAGGRAAGASEHDRGETAAGPRSADYLRIRLVGATATPSVRGRDALPGRVNYFRGRDPKRWQTDVATYARVQIDQVYPGIDLVYYGAEGHLAFDLLVAPGADPSAVRLAFDGAERVELDESGDLRITTRAGELRLPRPVIFQEVNEVRTNVQGGFVLQPEAETAEGARVKVGVEVARYDTSLPLVIDPVLVYSTYLGGAADEVGDGIAVDATGNIYVTGPTNSPDFPTANPIQTEFAGGSGCGDAFVAKLTPDGSALIYATYFGGLEQDCSHALAVDLEGSAYVTGRTGSPDFPLMNPMQAVCGSDATSFCADAFVTKLSPDGSALLYSSYLGGVESEFGAGIAVDPTGSAYITGGTTSPDFPTVNPIHGKIGLLRDVFIAKLNPQGSALIYSTFLGGTDTDGGQGIAVDTSGNAYVLATTESTDFPTINALQPASAGGIDLIIAKLDATGSTLLYSTYLGGSNHEGTGDITVDANGSVYLAGYTPSRDFPTKKPLQPAHHGGQFDAFVAKLHPGGSALVYSTYLGGSGDESGADIVIDEGGFAYITGLTQSEDFPVVKAPQSAYGGGLRDVFVSKLTPTGSALVFSTFLGGHSDDTGNAIALGPSDDVYVTGQAETPGVFPTVNPLQPVTGGGMDAFISRYSQTLAPEITVEPAITRFGLVPVGGAKTLPFFVHNTGDADLTVEWIAGLGPTLTLLGPVPPFKVQPGQRMPVWVRWTPTEPAQFREVALLGTDDLDEAVATAVLTGRAFTPAN